MSIIKYKIERGHSWIPSGLYGAQAVYRFPRSGKCASNHNWPITIYLTTCAIYE